MHLVCTMYAVDTQGVDINQSVSRCHRALGKVVQSHVTLSVHGLHSELERQKRYSGGVKMEEQCAVSCIFVWNCMICILCIHYSPEIMLSFFQRVPKRSTILLHTLWEEDAPHSEWWQLLIVLAHLSVEECVTTTCQLSCHISSKRQSLWIGGLLMSWLHHTRSSCWESTTYKHVIPNRNWLQFHAMSN